MALSLGAMDDPVGSTSSVLNAARSRIPPTNPADGRVTPLVSLLPETAPRPNNELAGAAFFNN